MAKVTAIKSQRNKKRVNIYLDGEFGFGLDLENFIKLRLKVEQELSEEEVEEIVKKAEYAKISDKLLRFATLRPRSRREIELWLKKHKVHESLHKKLFNKLERLELLDDELFAKWWVEQRVQFKFKSKRELVFELRAKGVDKEIINKITSIIRINEVESARKLVEKKMYKWQKLNESEARRKMSEYLSRKGFGWDIIKKTVDSFLKNE